jgi:hypothetical protein
MTADEFCPHNIQDVWGKDTEPLLLLLFQH